MKNSPNKNPESTKISARSKILILLGIAGLGLIGLGVSKMKNENTEPDKKTESAKAKSAEIVPNDKDIRKEKLRNVVKLILASQELKEHENGNDCEGLKFPVDNPPDEGFSIPNDPNSYFFYRDCVFRCPIKPGSTGWGSIDYTKCVPKGPSPNREYDAGPLDITSSGDCEEILH